MFSVRPLPEFTAWLDGIADATVRGIIAARIKRLERGLMGDVVPVGAGVSELRIRVGAGWRVYFTRRGAQLIVLLAGALNARRRAISSVPKRSRRCWINQRKPT